MKRARKELHCGSHEECALFVSTQGGNARLMEIVNLEPPGPAACVHWKSRAPGNEKGPRAVDFETRETVRVKGLESRPLIVTLDPQNDTITFRPKGTRQIVSVPILSLYQSARFTAARALANAKRAKKGNK